MPAWLDWLVRVVRQSWRRWWIDRCTQAASSLAYQTALALVPLLAVAFALLKSTGKLDAGSAMLEFLGQQILPSSQEAQAEIVQRLAGFVNNVAVGALGGLGLVATIITGFLLFLNVEEYWNRIWASPKKRTYLNKFLLFYAAVTLLPFLFSISLLHTAALWHKTRSTGFTLALIASPITFTLGNRLLPVCRVTWRAAATGGLASAVLFELAKYGFGLYLAWVTGSYRTIYGALGILPLFLLWIYVAWLTVLWGAEMTHAAQHLFALEAASRSRLSQDGDEVVIMDGTVAARLLLDVVRHYSAGKRALPADELERRHSLSEETVRRIFRRLEECNMVIPIDEAYVPARPPSQIYLHEVLSAFRPEDPDAQGKDDALERLLREVDDLMQQRIHAVSLFDLV